MLDLPTDAVPSVIDLVNVSSDNVFMKALSVKLAGEGCREEP
jgi:hypothetical protein